MIYLKLYYKDRTLVRCKAQRQISNSGKILIEFYYSWFLAKIMLVASLKFKLYR